MPPRSLTDLFSCGLHSHGVSCLLSLSKSKSWLDMCCTGANSVKVGAHCIPGALWDEHRSSRHHLCHNDVRLLCTSVFFSNQHLFRVGSALGWLTNLYQERLYQNYFATRSAEARLYLPCVAAVTLPSGCFIYAWTSYSDVHWIAPAIGITVLMWSVFVIYLAVFTYLADAYASSRLSAVAWY